MRGVGRGKKHRFQRKQRPLAVTAATKEKGEGPQGSLLVSNWPGKKEKQRVTGGRGGGGGGGEGVVNLCSLDNRETTSPAPSTPDSQSGDLEVFLLKEMTFLKGRREGGGTDREAVARPRPPAQCRAVLR